MTSAGKKAPAYPSAGGNPIQVGAKTLRVMFGKGLEDKLAA